MSQNDDYRRAMLVGFLKGYDGPPERAADEIIRIFGMPPMPPRRRSWRAVALEMAYFGVACLALLILINVALGK